MKPLTNREEVTSLYNKLKNFSRVGQLLGISRQRVHQIVKNYKNTGAIHGREHLYKTFGFCKVCGIKKAVHLHHIDFDNQNDQSANLIGVCKTCHYSIHKASGRKKTPYNPKWRDPT